MTPDTSRDDAAGPLDAAEQDPSAEADLGAGPAHTDRPEQDDVPKAPAGPGATPADPEQPLNPA